MKQPSLLMRAASVLCSVFFAAFAPGRAAPLPTDFIEQAVGSGWNAPVGIAFDTSAANNRSYVWERGGRVWIVENGVKFATPLVDISEEVMAWRDFGLLGVALDPQFQQNGFIYLLYVVDRHHLLTFGTPAYSATTDLYTAPSIGRITRFTARVADGFRTVDPASRRVLVGEAINRGFPILHESHGVGSLIFGADGTLLASCGDGASYNAMDDGGPDGGSLAAQALNEGIITAKENVGAFRSQLLDSLNGKILRLDPATGDGIASNPYFDAANPRSAKSRVWTLGLRNPYRITLRPGTGAHDPAAASPGTIYLGDVGWSAWEDMHAVTGPGKNCGWPLFEGLEAQSQYQASPAVNLDAPNPLGGFFRFKDLLIQDTLATPSWPNPANASQQVPANVPRWVHSRPVLDFQHGADLARTGTFSGTTATVSALGSAGCPVAGPSFRGNASTGGVFLDSEDFPEAYHGTYFHADFGGQWIKNIVVGANDRPVEVRPFASGTGPIVFVATHPATGGLYYIHFDGNVRRITYAPGGNQTPTALATVAPNYGPSPLTVQFNGSASFDPDGPTLGYLWTFDDGTTSTLANPAHTFTTADTRKFNATLTVTDSSGATSTAAVAVFANHAPPVVVVTSPINGTKYPVGAAATYPLNATITPQPGHPVTSTWQTILHHDNHAHLDAPIAGPNASLTTGGEGAGFYYENVLTVIDDLGLTVAISINLLPNITNVVPGLAWSVASRHLPVGSANVLDAAATASDADSATLEGGELRVQLVGGTSNETPGLRNEGNGAGQIGVSGASVSHSGVAIGTLSVSNSLLVVMFNAAATPAAAQAALRNVTYLSTVATTRTVRATLADGDGGTSPAADLAVTTTGGNLKPIVTITSPASGALFTAPATIDIAANASDPDGTIARVEFYRGSKRISIDTTEPYTATWLNAPAGTYNLRARARDNQGAIMWSAKIPIRITASTTTLLADDFNDNSRDTAKWSPGTIAGTIYSGAAAFDAAIALDERNQRLEIPLRSGVGGDRYNGYVATTARDFTDASASVEIVQAASGFADTMLAVSKDAQNLVLMVVEGGDLYLDHIIGGGRHITGLPFNPAQHRFWRIRHVAGPPAELCFQTSADAVNWQTLRRDSVQFAVTALRPEVSAGTWQPESAPGTAIFDNFKMERGGVEPPAPTNEPPIADPAGPYTGVAGQVIALSASDSIDFDGTITTWAWDFGDGTNGSGENVAKTFASAGTYTVLLRVTDNLGTFSEETTTVTVTAAPTNQPPVARPGGPYVGATGGVISFDGSASSDPDGTIASYAWNFGDGATGTGATPAHGYTNAGTFNVTLTVTDNSGATHTASTTATISPNVLLADDFNDNTPDPAKWRLGAILGTIYAGSAGADPLVLVAERNARLEITPRVGVGGDHYFGYLSNPLNLAGASVRVQAVQPPGGAADAILSLSIDGQNFAAMGVEGGYLFFDQTIAGQRTPTVINYNATAHRYWRIRHVVAGDTLAFETSADANTWTTLRSSPRRLPLGAVSIELSAGTWQNEAAPGIAAFDDLRAER
ncbi:MAG: PKD domain-containing protein [Chthoniobacteraceae bacterium]